jgi:hypothetical protein
VRLPRGPSTREGAYIQIVRVLVTVSPLMYREAIALSLRQRHPDFEVRIAPPEAAEEEVKGFGPHLLVHNDTDGLDRSVLESVPCRVEVATATAWTQRSARTGASRSSATSPPTTCCGLRTRWRLGCVELSSRPLGGLTEGSSLHHPPRLSPLW